MVQTRFPGVRHIKAPKPSGGEDMATIEDKVRKILADVRKRGDVAVADYSKQFDGYELSLIHI